MVVRSMFPRFFRHPLRYGLLVAGLLLPSLGPAHPHGPGNGGSAPPENPELTQDPDLFLQVTLARRGEEPTKREAYVLDLVELALNAAGVEHELSVDGHGHDDDALVHALTDDHHHANLAVEPPDAELTNTLRPVYFPVHRGLPGYRLLVIARGDQERFNQASGLDALRGMTAAVRAGSGDRAFMKPSADRRGQAGQACGRDSGGTRGFCRPAPGACARRREERPASDAGENSGAGLAR